MSLIKLLKDVTIEGVPQLQGDVFERPDAEAKALVDEGSATFVEGTVTSASAPEEAAPEAAPEEAAPAESTPEEAPASDDGEEDEG